MEIDRDGGDEYAPGIFYNIRVKLVSSAEIEGLSKEKGTWGMLDEEVNTLYLNKELETSARRSTFYHELAHHLLNTLDDELKNADEELKCDVIGAFLQKLVEAERGAF